MILSWQYILIFLGVAIEGPAVTLAAAALAGSGALNPYLVFLAASSGNIIGDMSWYMLGWVGKFENSLVWFPPLRRIEPQIIGLKGQINQHLSKMLLATKLALGIGTIPTLIAAGMARVAWWRVMGIQLIGEIIWSGSLVLIGLFWGQYIARLEHTMHLAAIIGGALFIAGLIYLVGKQLGNNPNYDRC